MIQERVGKVRVDQKHAEQVRLGEARVAQIRCNQVRAGHLRTVQDSAAEPGNIILAVPGGARYERIQYLLRPSGTQVFDRLLEVVLPQGGYVTLFEAYIDESGCDEGSRVLCVAGYLLRSDFARDMAWRWKEILSAHNLPYFHMVDCAHGAEEFKRLDRDQRIAVAAACIDLIK